MRTPERRPTEAVDPRLRLRAAVEPIQGWLEPGEAWALHELARRALPEGTLAVEIGSWKGRSTVAIGLGLDARDDGVLLAVDPHERADDRYREMLDNLARAGVGARVRPIRRRSAEARAEVPDRTVGLLFVDGSHEYEDVLTDLETWRDALVPGAVVGFNDPFWAGVVRVLDEHVLQVRSPFRDAWLVGNTLFFEYRPGAPWGPHEDEALRQARTVLEAGRAWGRLQTRISFGRLPRPARRSLIMEGVRLLRRWAAKRLVPPRPDGPLSFLAG